tara:strand:- start:563 stop:1117 length:555 start_codon:yes stop_codon:yes gene_type:complete
MHSKITKRIIERTPTPPKGDLFIRDTQLKGFGARITSKGSVSFFAEGKIKSIGSKRLSLDRYPLIDIATARTLAKSALYHFSRGTVPERTATNKTQVSLKATVERYLSSRTLKSEGDYRRVTKRVFGDWFDKPVRSISREDVESRYRLLAIKKGRKAQTNKAMRYLNIVLNFALFKNDLRHTPE